MLTEKIVNKVTNCLERGTEKVREYKHKYDTDKDFKEKTDCALFYGALWLVTLMVTGPKNRS